MDKGIIFDLENSIEGIVPLKRMQKHEKNQILANFKEGDSHKVTVQEVDEEYKKIILMMDLGLSGVEAEEEPVELVEESEPQKIEVPQDIIDNVSEDNSDVESVEETEESKEDSEESADDSSDADEETEELAEESKEDPEESADDSSDTDESKDE
mgnify:CR=1 FL=1